MPAPPNYVFTIFGFVAFFLCLIRFPMQLHAWSVGIHIFLAWAGLSCLFWGINSIIWNHNTVNWAPVWCDITTRFSLGASVAIPATFLSINRRLYLLASPASILPSQADMRREIVFNLVIGIGLPIIVMILSFFAQDARFVIVEDYGCGAAISRTWVSLVVVYIPPILLEVIAFIYDCLSIYAFYQRRSELKEFSPTHRLYIRLMCFSVSDLLVGIPFTAFYLYLNVTPLIPFTDLKEEHYHFSQVRQLPAIVWRATMISELTWELNRWIAVWCALVFFAIFGFTKESRNNYRAVLQSVVQIFTKMTGIKRRPSSKAEGIIFKAATRELDTVNSNLAV